MKTYEVAIETVGNEVQVTAPYNIDFVREARNLGGKWKSFEKLWIFPVAQKDRISNVCMRIFGCDGETEPATCTIRITAHYRGTTSDDRTPLLFCGRQVAYGFARDSGARLSDGVVLLEGNVSTGGSRKWWCVNVDGGSVFELSEFPVSLLSKAKEEVADKYSDWDDLKILDDGVEEAARLEAIEQIQALMEKHSISVSELSYEARS